MDLEKSWNEPIANLAHVGPVFRKTTQESLFADGAGQIDRTPNAVQRDRGKAERGSVPENGEEEKQQLAHRAGMPNDAVQAFGLNLLVR